MVTRRSPVDPSKIGIAGATKPPRSLLLALLLCVTVGALNPIVQPAFTTVSPAGFERPPPVSMGERDPFSFIEPIHLIATVDAPTIVARTSPDEDAPALAEFPEITPDGVSQVFLLTARPGERPAIESEDGTWYEAYLPIRPNGSIGFIPAEAVTLSTTAYRLVVDRDAFQLTLWKGAEVVTQMPIGLGTGETPTPVGRFYLTTLIRPSSSDSVYGSFAYGLSGYSEVLTDWVGGGIVGLHGTNDPSSIGRNASHGCIRMHNADIEELVPLLPLGTPIEIL